MSEYYDSELEEIKKKRLEEFMKRLEEERRRKEEEMAREAQRQAILRRIMTPEARGRLANVRLVRPELARAVEDYIINLALAGHLRGVVDDDTLKRILMELDSRSRRDYRIVIKEKR